MENNSRVKALVRLYLDDQISKDEWEELKRLLQDGSGAPEIEAELLHRIEKGIYPELFTREQLDQQYLKLAPHLGNATADTTVKSIRSWRWIRPAAAVLLLLGTGLLFLINRDKKPLTAGNAGAQQHSQHSNAAGTLLTLANGDEMVLDEAGNGEVAMQNGTHVKMQQGVLIYEGHEGSGEPAAASAIRNTITTPRGKQFRIQLPDGSTAWLNAESAVTFPVRFTPNERTVSITGEVYFEVKKLAAQADGAVPFRVIVDGGAEIEVLGTHFNVNAYRNNGRITATLLEGKIRFSRENQAAILRPGEGATAGLHDGSTPIQVTAADTAGVMSWKNGLFDFNNAPLEEVLRELARWYPIDVRYENGVPDMRFDGRLGRDVSLPRMLSFFRESGVQFRMEGNLLIIENK